MISIFLPRMSCESSVTRAPHTKLYVEKIRVIPIDKVELDHYASAGIEPEDRRSVVIGTIYNIYGA